jgi:hypothetical protein
VAELLGRMSSYELSEWEKYFEIEGEDMKNQLPRS